MSTRRCWWRRATTTIAPIRAIAATTPSPPAARSWTTRCGATRRRMTPWPRLRTTSPSIPTASIRSNSFRAVPSVPPLVAEHRYLFREPFEPPLAERDEPRRVAAAEFTHHARHDDAVSLGLAA